MATLSVELQPVPADGVLEGLWKELEPRSAHSFFLSWPWIGTWVHAVRGSCDLQLVQVRDGSTVIGAALMARRTLRRRRFVVSRTWLPHVTGDPAQDGVCIEFNGFLALPERRLEVWQAMLTELLLTQPDADEMRLDGFDGELVQAAGALGLHFNTHVVATGRFVDLAAIRASGGDALSVVSGQSRKKLRKKRSLFEAAHGPITVAAASSAAEALRWLDALGEFNTRRWQGRGDEAFRDPFFMGFHRALIERHFDQGAVQVLRVNAGAEPLAYTFNFIHRGVLYAYQSGINYDLRLKTESPGVLGHWLSIQYNLEQGLDRYEMMGNDSEYKRTLCPGEQPKYWGTLQRPRLKFTLERAAMALVRRLRGKPGAG